LVVATAALAAAGCGGSSKNSTSTATNSGSGSNVSLSTPIDSPQARALIIKGEQSQFQGRFNQRQVNAFTDCVIKKFEAAGVKTLGDLQQHETEARGFGAQCASSLRS
jgi:hypothetical protein